MNLVDQMYARADEKPGHYAAMLERWKNLLTPEEERRIRWIDGGWKKRPFKLAPRKAN